MADQGGADTTASTLGPLTARLFDTPNGPIEAAVVGAGPPLIVIHGTGGSWRQSAPLAEDFAGSWTVVLVSRPGYGRTPLASGPTLEAQARTLKGLLSTLNLGPSVVMGMSGGGPMALAFAALTPEACRGLILCCAMAPHYMEPSTLIWAALVPGVVGAFARSRAEAAREALADPAKARVFYDDQLTENERALVAADPSRARNFEDFLRRTAEAPLGRDGLALDAKGVRQAWRVSPAAMRVMRSPTLILHGDADTVVPYSHAAYHATAIPGADLETYGDAGHLFLLSMRPEARKRIATFLATL